MLFYIRIILISYSNDIRFDLYKNYIIPLYDYGMIEIAWQLIT